MFCFIFFLFNRAYSRLFTKLCRFVELLLCFLGEKARFSRKTRVFTRCSAVFMDEIALFLVADMSFLASFA